MEYDGVSWRVIYIGDRKCARSIAISDEGTVYVGGYNEIGYLKPDENGLLHFESLVSLLPEELRNFSNVWSTHATSDGIFFRTSYSLIRLRVRKANQIYVWTEERPRAFRAFYICNNESWVLIRGVGLHRMVKDKLELLPGTEIFKDYPIKMIEPYPCMDDINSKLFLLGVAKKGFYLYDCKKMKKFLLKSEDQLIIQNLYYGTRLSTGDYALSTQVGLYIVDINGNIRFRVDKKYGLQSENVRSVFEDNGGNIWLCLENGISRFEYPSPFTFSDNRLELEGVVYTILEHRSHLYAGTSRGLYYSESKASFKPIPEIPRACNSLISVGESILAAGINGVFEGKKNEWRQILPGKSYVLVQSISYPDTILCGRAGELVVISKINGQWKITFRVDTNHKEVRSIREVKNKNVWAIAASTVYNFNLPPPVSGGEGHGMVITFYDYKDNGELFPDGALHLSIIDNRCILATPKGLRYLPHDKNLNEMVVPYLGLGSDLANKKISRIAEDNQKNVWIYSEGTIYRAVPSPDGQFNIISLPFRRLPIRTHITDIYPRSEKNSIWFGTIEGLILYNYPDKKNYTLKYNSLIRTVDVDNKLYYGGYKQNEHVTPEIKYKNRRNIHFEFAAPYFENENETLYSIFLEGFDKKWSEWSKRNKKDYTLLDFGNYHFRVKAKNIYRQESKEDVFQFRILHPWYLTWWSFLIWGAFFVMLFFQILGWRLSSLEKEKTKLELAIQERTKEIAGKNRQLKKQNGRLIEQSKKLKEFDEAKSRFFANISHEFRTPLTLIISPLEQMLLDGVDKQQTEKFRIMLHNSQRLLYLINQLLELARIDSKNMRLRVTEQNIVSFIEAITSNFTVLTQKNQLILKFHSSEKNVPIYFDPKLMEEAISNLLINASKFTSPHGSITVSVSSAKDCIEISVKDTGKGINSEHIFFIFDRFYKGEDAGTMDYNGTGIGLALTKEIISLHKGTIDVHSQEGKGTEFVIRLKTGKLHFSPDEIVYKNESQAPLLADDHRQHITMLEDIEIQEEDRDNKTLPKPYTILIVEDDSIQRKLLIRYLSKQYKIIEATDGQKGLENARTIQPDLIVSDIMMPGLDGYELCKKLKNDVITAHIPVILLTARASDESIIQGLETGADDYVIKPFKMKILLARIKNLIDQRQQIQSNKKITPATVIFYSPRDEHFFNELRKTLETHLSDPDLDINTLCENLGIGSKELCEKIKSLTGNTPEHYILSFRLEKAMQLLESQFGGVTNVAFEVGFPSTADFARKFKEKFGQIPAYYLNKEAKV